MLLAAVGAGFGHGLVRGPQVDLAMHISENELSHIGSNTVMGSFRFMERGGSVLGLVAIAAATTYLGYDGAIGLIGVLVLLGVLSFFISSSIGKKVKCKVTGEA
jgi:hypothetical protein